tara:strand:- start:675 stop:872 length:198 start_codon:yes stop_codon:yes gene_type:complete
MSLEFPSTLEKPSNITPLPGNFIRPSFEKLYGFDVPQEDVIDGAIFTEAGEPLTTELNEILLFEP